MSCRTLAALSTTLSAALPGLALVASLAAVEPAAAQAPAASPATDRPRIGLVLGGGGARGAAHIGVLEVLERERIAVDCVAGTSMGALVAGAWSAGLSPAQMREALAQADWADMFQDNPDYADLNFRSKRLSQRFLPGSETGLTAAGAVTPPGVVSGQKIKLFFNRLVRADAGEREMQQLALPVSIVATDIGSGQRVVLRDGSLTQAMRASMSVPGLLAPLEYRGHKLVDGGLVDNVPVREVRERCGAEVVIAVNVGSPLLPPERVSGLLSVTAQMVALLTEQNVQGSLATLGARDILIQPDLGPITAADFERHEEAARRGAAAAEAVVARLKPLALPAEQWAAWRAPMTTQPAEALRIDAVEIAGLSRVDEAVVQRYLGDRTGRPLDTRTLDRDLLRAYGDGWYERVDYAVLAVDGKNVLRVTPVEKSWGPDYLRLGLRLDSNFSQGSTYQLRAAYHRTWLNKLGGEWLLTGELGSNTGVETEWFQPVSRDRFVFVDALAGYRRERNDVFFVEQRIAEYRTVRTKVELSAGLHFSLVGQLRAGWRESKVTNELETGLDVLSLLPERSAGGPLITLDLDQLDRLYFPRRGWSIAGEWFQSDRRDYSRLVLDLRGATPLPGAPEWVIGSRATWVTSPRGNLPLNEAGRLGGLLNMTAFATGQLVGDDVAYAHVRAERIVGRAPLGLRGDLRLGLALEAGRVGQPYARQKQDGWLHSAAVYLGGETVLGPVFLGIGRGSGGSTNAYLVIGTP